MLGTGLTGKTGLAGISETEESVDDESAEILTITLKRKSSKTFEGRICSVIFFGCLKSQMYKGFSF